MAGRPKGSPFPLRRPHTLARPSSPPGTAQPPLPQPDIWVATHLAAGSSLGPFFKAPTLSIFSQRAIGDPGCGAKPGRSHASLLLPGHLALKLHLDALDMFPHVGLGGSHGPVGQSEPWSPPSQSSMPATLPIYPLNSY